VTASKNLMKKDLKCDFRGVNRDLVQKVYYLRGKGLTKAAYSTILILLVYTISKYLRVL
jgi:hypothetical protein